MRTGKYIKQTTGYNAFIPASLPPEPPIDVDNEMQELLSNADRALGRLDGAVHTLPNPDWFIYMYIRKEAVLSSQIEGTQSSLNHLLEAEAQINDFNRPKDVSEVINYVDAMNYGLERLQALPLSSRLICKIHKRLLSNVRGNKLNPGEYRKTQNWIGASGCTLNEAIFVPPPPYSIQDHISDLEKFIHANDNIPVLIKTGLIHAQFETIHPFLDGNGRVGRLLITFSLCQRSILTKPVLYLSFFFKKHRTQYYELLQSTRDNGDLEAWLKFFLRGIYEVSKEATATCRSIVTLRELHREKILHELGRIAANGIRVLEHMYQQPIITINDTANLLDVSYPAANGLMERLEKAEIVEEITGQTRNRRYKYFDYINMFI